MASGLKRDRESQATQAGCQTAFHLTEHDGLASFEVLQTTVLSEMKHDLARSFLPHLK